MKWNAVQEKAARTSPGEAPRLGHLRTKVRWRNELLLRGFGKKSTFLTPNDRQVAKDHLQDMHNKHLEQQQALDEIQAK